MKCKIPVHSCRNIFIPMDSSPIPAGIKSFQSHSMDSSGFQSYSAGFLQILVIPAGICGASKSTASAKVCHLKLRGAVRTLAKVYI
jgi:hypothetical protein